MIGRTNAVIQVGAKTVARGSGTFALENVVYALNVDIPKASWIIGYLSVENGETITKMIQYANSTGPINVQKDSHIVVYVNLMESSGEFIFDGTNAELIPGNQAMNYIQVTGPGEGTLSFWVP